MADLKASILCLTYNHESFIREALDSFMMQKTNFNYEVIIGEDYSLDKTREVIKEFEQKYPQTIRPIYRNQNIGLIENIIDTLCQVRGKYVAYCEGDDYWTDPYKLQKQVDFLEAHDDYMFCAGQSLKRDGNNYKHFPPAKTGTITFKDIAHRNFIVTNTLVFRNIFKKSELYRMSNYLRRAPYADVFFSLSLLLKGKGYVLPDYIGVYRLHDNALMSKKSDKEKYYQVFNIRNIIIEYLKDIHADDRYIKDVEHGYSLMFIKYLNRNMLTEEFIEIIPSNILLAAINNYQRQRMIGSTGSSMAERETAVEMLAEIKNSTSWRLTAPIRLAGCFVKRCFSKLSYVIRSVEKFISSRNNNIMT